MTPVIEEISWSPRWERGSEAALRRGAEVSRGLGTSLIPIRLGSTPELALIDWYPRSG